MPSFGNKKHFHPFLISVYKMSDTVNFEDNLFVRFQWLSNNNFKFKVCDTDCLVPGFDKQLILSNFYLMV